MIRLDNLEFSDYLILAGQYYCFVEIYFQCFRGFLKGDKTLGQATVKLAVFDNKCEIHECVDVRLFISHGITTHDVIIWY